MLDKTGMGQKRSRQSADALQPRKQGVLHNWVHNHDAPHSFARGFGFITPDVGANDIFVHAGSLQTAEGIATGTRVEYTEFFDARQPSAKALVARDVVALALRRTWSQKRQRQDLPSHVGGVGASSGAEQSLDQRLASFVESQLQKHGLDGRTNTQLATALYKSYVEARAHVSAAGGMRKWLESSLGRRIKVTSHPTGQDLVQLAHSLSERDRNRLGARGAGKAPAVHHRAPGVQELRDRKLDSSLDEIVASARSQAVGLQVRPLEEIMEEKRKQAREITVEKESRLGGRVAVSSNGSGSTSAKRLRTDPAASSSASGKRHAAASAPEEKRYDDDGRGGQKLYTKAEFVELYGGHAEWNAANRPPPPRAQPVAPASPRAGAGAPLERRYDDDGRGGRKLYTKAEFFKEYGGTAEWQRAAREQQQQLSIGLVSRSSASRQTLDSKASQGLQSAARPLSKREGKRPVQAESANGLVVMEFELQVSAHKRQLIADKSGCNLVHTTVRGHFSVQGNARQLRHAADLLLKDAKGAKGGAPELRVAADDTQAGWVLGKRGGTLQKLQKRHVGEKKHAEKRQAGVSFQIWRPNGSARVISLRGEPSQIKEAVYDIAELWLGQGTVPSSWLQLSGGSAGGSSSSAAGQSSPGASAGPIEVRVRSLQEMRAGKSVGAGASAPPSSGKANVVTPKQLSAQPNSTPEPTPSPPLAAASAGPSVASPAVLPAVPPAAPSPQPPPQLPPKLPPQLTPQPSPQPLLQPPPQPSAWSPAQPPGRGKRTICGTDGCILARHHAGLCECPAPTSRRNRTQAPAEEVGSERAMPPRCEGPSQDLGEDDDGVEEDDALSFGSDAPLSMEGFSLAGAAPVAADTSRETLFLERQDGEEAAARAEQDRRVEDQRMAEMEARHRLEMQRQSDEHYRRLEEERRRDRQLKEQAPLSEEKFKDTVEAIKQAIEREREHSVKRSTEKKGKHLKVRREPLVCAFTAGDVYSSTSPVELSVAGGVVKVNNIERAVLWGKQVPEEISRAKILSVEECVGGRLEVQGAEMLRENPMTGLVAQVLAFMGKVKSQAGLWRPTKVIFDDEDGVDQGGLTIEMHVAFWEGVTSEQLELFECADQTHSKDQPTSFLPKPGACTHSLEMVGLMLCKSLIDSHPTGPGLGQFVFDFLLEAEGKQSRAFAKESKPIMEQAETAIDSLSHFDVQYASMCKRYLREHETGELRTSESIATQFGDWTLADIVKLPDGHELSDEPVTIDNLPHAVLATSQWVLRESRLPQLQALRHGFTRYVSSNN